MGNSSSLELRATVEVTSAMTLALLSNIVKQQLDASQETTTKNSQNEREKSPA